VFWLRERLETLSVVAGSFLVAKPIGGVLSGGERVATLMP
jgi:hypothetical protein